MSRERRSGGGGPVFQEILFGFRHDAFRAYMRTRSFSRADPEVSYTQYEQMSRSSVPIVVYAAGWVLAELATSRQQAVSAARRDEAISKFPELWNNALRDTNDRYQRASSDGNRKMMLEYFNLGLQIRFSQVHIPALRAVSGHIASETSPQSVDVETYDKLMAYSEWLLGQQQESESLYQPLVTGAISEAEVSALLHRTPPPNVLVAPSSVRQQGNPDESLRADLISHNFSDNAYIKQLIQVKTRQVKTQQRGGNNPYYNTILVHTVPYLTFRDGSEPADVLNHLVNEHERKKGNGKNQLVFSPHDIEIDEMTSWLLTEIRKY